MVKKLYLILIFTIFYTACSHASAYLASSKNYKFYINALCTNKNSTEHKNAINKFNRIFYNINNLQKKVDNIHKTISEEDRQLTNLEEAQVKSLKQNISELKREANAISIFADSSLYTINIEYGLTDYQTLGLKIDYKENDFSTLENTKIYTYKNIVFLYKYKMFEANNIIVTLQPTFSYSIYNNISSYNKNISLLAARSDYKGKKVKYEHLQEIGITASHLGQGNNELFGFSLHLLEGIKFHNDITITNYVSYKRMKHENLFYSNTLYNQISVAKTFSSAILGFKDITIQAGYFWKHSFANKTYTVSGPIFSLWYVL